MSIIVHNILLPLQKNIILANPLSSVLRGTPVFYLVGEIGVLKGNNKER